MLSIKTTIKNLDFDSLIRFGLPILKANPPEIDSNLFIKQGVKKLLEVEDSKIFTVLEIIPDSIKLILASKIIANSHEKIEAFITSFAESQNLYFKINDISVSKEFVEKSFDISCVVSEIDYNSFVKKFLPSVHLDDSQKINMFLNSLFNAMISEMDSTERLLSAIPESVKDNLVSFFIEQNSIKLCESLTAFIMGKKINLKVDSLLVEIPCKSDNLIGATSIGE